MGLERVKEVVRAGELEGGGCKAFLGGRFEYIISLYFFFLALSFESDVFLVFGYSKVVASFIYILDY